MDNVMHLTTIKCEKSYICKLPNEKDTYFSIYIPRPFVSMVNLALVPCNMSFHSKLFRIYDSSLERVGAIQRSLFIDKANIIVSSRL